MSSPFVHTIRSLRLEDQRGACYPLLLAGVLATAWLSWMSLARVPVIASSEDARVEVVDAGQPITAPVEGRVARVALAVGDPVSAGELIVELDSEATALELAELRERRRSIVRQISVRDREIAAQREAMEALERATGAAASEAKARVEEAVVAARLTRSRVEETDYLATQDVVGASELRQSHAELEQREASARALRSAGQRERYDLELAVEDRLVALVRAEGEREALVGEQRKLEAEQRRLEARLEDHRLRASISGVVGELATIEPGAWIERGEQIATIVPDGELRVVASFSPAAALGRVAPGQPALLRLSGFPWTEYGVIQARVARVAKEVRRGSIRVELDIVSVPSVIELSHGLPGAVEVEVERSSPARLLLRAAGRRVQQRAAASEDAPATRADASAGERATR